MSKVTYNVIYQVCGQVTTDIPDDITTRGYRLPGEELEKHAFPEKRRVYLRFGRARY